MKRSPFDPASMIELAYTVVLVFGTFSTGVAAESPVEGHATISTGSKDAITQGAVPRDQPQTHTPGFIMTKDGELKQIKVPPPYTTKPNTKTPGVDSSPFQEGIVIQTTSSRRRRNNDAGSACFFVFVFLIIMFIGVVAGATGASKKKGRGGGWFGGCGGGGCGGGGCSGGGCGGGGCGGCGGG